jgi:hypothetical protein
MINLQERHVRRRTNCKLPRGRESHDIRADSSRSAEAGQIRLEDDVISDLHPIMDALRVLSRENERCKIDRVRAAEQVIKSWIAGQDLVEQRRRLQTLDHQITSQETTEFWTVISAYVAQQLNVLQDPDEH